MTQMQGIVSILRSDNLEKTTKVSPLRRTLSADMSSKRWLAESGLPMMKKIAYSEQIAIIDSSSSSESDEEECEVNGKGDKNPSRMDIWTAIMSQKKQDDSGKLPPPYVHPLVKKSARSLSDKSLKVCTESLGSETGSDVFMFNPMASSEDATREQQKPQEQPQPQPQQPEQTGEHKLVKHASPTTKKAQVARSFPPPLPSLAAAHTDGPSLHMHSRRVEGRLVLEAVSVPPQKYFEAQRQDGRFLLALIKDPIDEAIEQPQPIQNEFVDVFNISEEEKTVDNDNNNENENEDEDEDEFDEDDDQIEMNFIDKDIGIIKEPPLDSTKKFINVHKSTITTNKLAERDNENPTWSRKLNTKLSNITTNKLEVTEQDQQESSPITQSLPPVPRTIKGRPPLPRPPTAATSVNSYQYFWRSKPSVASVIDPMITQHPPPTKTKDMVLLRGNKSDCLIPNSLIGCKVPRKSLVMWEPFCIATS